MEQGIISQVIRSRRRTLALQIAPDASLIIRAPHRASDEAIRQAVKNKMPWILKRQRLARETFRPPVKHDFIDGEEFLYMGQWRKLVVVPGARIPLVFNENEFLLSGAYLPEAQRLFKKWYREKALEIIKERIKQYAEMTGLKYSKISVTSAKKRWGSCSFKGNLNFSWRLIMAPPEVIDYVIIHELAHIEEHNHSARYWDKVRALFPDYRQAKQWLHSNHLLLNL
jgi:hypothetical protein